MSRLFYFFYQYRALFLFLALEVFSSWLIVENSQYQSANFFNSSNKIVANFLGFTYRIKNYLALQDINQEIAKENAKLKTTLAQLSQSFYFLNAREHENWAMINRFTYVNAEVINNSVNRFKNYITIDKGGYEGIKPGMAVIGSTGAVGKVKFTSQHYAVVASLLNMDVYVSSVIKNTNHFGTIRWRGMDHQYTNLEFIPYHATPSVGDTIVTSGFNAVFPKGVQIGIISNVMLSKKKQFYDLKVKLLQDFTQLSFVQVIQSNLKTEKDSLEQTTAIY